MNRNKNITAEDKYTNKTVEMAKFGLFGVSIIALIMFFIVFTSSEEELASASGLGIAFLFMTLLYGFLPLVVIYTLYSSYMALKNKEDSRNKFIKFVFYLDVVLLTGFLIFIYWAFFIDI